MKSKILIFVYNLKFIFKFRKLFIFYIFIRRQSWFSAPYITISIINLIKICYNINILINNKNNSNYKVKTNYLFFL